VEEYIVLFLRVVVLVPFRPVITHSVGEQLAPGAEAAFGDGLFQLFGRLKLSAGVFVPVAEPAVRAHSGERSVMWMEADVVDGEDVLEAVVRAVRAMTFEREVVLRVNGVHVLNGYPALDAAQREANGRRLRLLLVDEDRDTAVLVLERGVQALVLLQTVLQVVHNYAFVGGAHHCHRVVHVGAVAPLRQLHRLYGRWLTHVPQFECLIPTASHNTSIVLCFNEVNGFDGRVVLCHLYGLIAVQIPHLHRLIT